MQVQHESGKLHAPFPSKFVFIYKQEVIVHFVQSVLIYLNEFVSASSAARIEERLKPVSRKSSPTPNLGLIISESSTSNIQGIELETNFGHIGVTTPSPPNGNERVANIESSSISPSKNATDHIIAMNTNPSSQSLATAGTINTNPAACNYNKHPTNGPLNALKNSYVLLARSYSRLLLYCSNFESSIEDLRFFECLLFFVNTVVKFSIPIEELWPKLEEETERIFRGGFRSESGRVGMNTFSDVDDGNFKAASGGSGEKKNKETNKIVHSNKINNNNSNLTTKFALSFGKNHTAISSTQIQFSEHAEQLPPLRNHEERVNAVNQWATANLVTAEQLRKYIESPRRRAATKRPKKKTYNMKRNLSLSPAVQIIIS